MSVWNKILIGVIVVLVCWIVFQDCKGDTKATSGTLKKEVKIVEQKRDTAKKQAAKIEIKQKEAKAKYRGAKATTRSSRIVQNIDTNIDTVSVCDTIVKTIFIACDSVIYQDSLLIDKLKVVIYLDSIALKMKDDIIRANEKAISDTCKYFTKQIRKHKWKTRGIITLWILREGASAARQ